jgi:hypothetical protein
MTMSWNDHLAGSCGSNVSTQAEHPASVELAFETLVAPLPRDVRVEFARRATHGTPLPQIPADLFEAVHSWAISAAIAEGSGEYSGGRGKPDWTSYVELQRRHIAIFQTLQVVFGPPSPLIVEAFHNYERDFPPPVRRMGDGWEPIVNDVAGRLIYSQPVDAGFVGTSFSFSIHQRDLAVLLADPWRRAVLEAVGHAVLQRSMIRDNPAVTEQDFRRLVDMTLHSDTEELARFIEVFSHDYHTDIVYFADAAMRRRVDHRLQAT